MFSDMHVRATAKGAMGHEPKLANIKSAFEIPIFGYIVNEEQVGLDDNQ